LIRASESLHHGYILLYSGPVFLTRGIERFSAEENLGKILKVSHFYLGFSLYENNDGIRHSYRGMLEFSGCENPKQIVGNFPENLGRR